MSKDNQLFKAGEAILNNTLRFASVSGAHAASIYGAFPSLPSLTSLQSLTTEVNYDLS